MKITPAVVFSVVFWLTTNSASCSVGDRSEVYQKCLSRCIKVACKDGGYDYRSQEPYYIWDCHGECQYNCMWDAVEWFQAQHRDIPQFYGKWPFLRVLYVQEFAAVLFSVLNLLAHVVMLYTFRQTVSANAPFYWFCHLYSLVCINAWFWSAAFHTRDTFFTEVMDYLSAFGMMVFSLYHLLIRLRDDVLNLWTAGVTAVLLTFFLHHAKSLTTGNIHYGYNMTLNIAVGLINVIGWCWWSWHRKRRQPYVKQAAFAVLVLAGTTILEIFDFAPIGWLIDAHALWHLSTFPLPFLWYRFLMDDCNYLREDKLYSKIS